MRGILRYVAILLAAALVFAAARYLDNAPYRKTDMPRSEKTTLRATEPQPQETEALPERESQPAETTPVEETTQPLREAESFLLTFVGDCTLGCREAHTYIDYGFTKVIGEDYGFPFRNVLPYFEEDDFTLINLEGPLTDDGYATQKAHTFSGPTAYVSILTENSVDAVTLANNHTMDYHQTGYDSTRATLESAGVPYVERDNSLIVTTDSGLTVAVYGAVYYLLDTEVITTAISQLREQADIVIFAPHWGVEGSYAPNEEQIQLAHAAIDAGADIVYGSHPHVLQPIEEYNGGVIYYSMGNFSFGGNIYPDDYDSALIQQEVLLQEDGSFCLGERTVVPVCLSSVEGRNNFQPTPYEEGSAEYERVLAKLAGTWKR